MSGAALLERLTVTPLADEEADVLAVMLAEDMVDWPADAWVVVDDYQELAVARPAERFLETLMMETRLNLLVLARRRPIWASSRRILYGEMFELGRVELAMTDEEARELLANTPDPNILIDLARGWPAALGLASMSGAAAPDLLAAPHLYNFFADEIYQRLDRRVRRALSELALYEPQGRRVALALLPSEESQRILRVGLDRGFITELDGSRLEMHPLLRSFLERKLKEESPEATSELVARAVRNLISNELWDEAFGIIDRFGQYTLVPELLDAALEQMLASGRSATLKTWMTHAPQQAAPVQLAAAELAFREGRFHESEAVATHAARVLGPDAELQARAYITAGRAAHAASREEEAFHAYQQARTLTNVPSRQRVAMVGELGAAVELELENDAYALFEALGPLEALEPRDRVILTDKQLNLQVHFGAMIAFEQGRTARQLLRFADPIERCSFRNVFGYLLASGGYYREALELTEEQIEDAQRFRLEFVIPYAMVVRALAESGLHEYAAADESLAEAEERSSSASDQTAELIAWAVRTRLYNAQGAFDLALARPLPPPEEWLRSIHAELVASYAISSAGSDHWDRARQLANCAERSLGPEARIGAACARAIIELRAGAHDEGLQEAKVALSRAGSSGLIEPLVSAYRGCPEIVVSLLSDRESHDDLMRVVAQAGDSELMSVSSPTGHSIFTLSRREKEVLALLAQGHSNREIGQALFISPVTVKVHVRHIYEKLGVHSRAEAVMRAAQLTR